MAFLTEEEKQNVTNAVYWLETYNGQLSSNAENAENTEKKRLIALLSRILAWFANLPQGKKIKADIAAQKLNEALQNTTRLITAMIQHGEPAADSTASNLLISLRWLETTFIPAKKAKLAARLAKVAEAKEGVSDTQPLLSRGIPHSDEEAKSNARVSKPPSRLSRFRRALFVNSRRATQVIMFGLFVALQYINVAFITPFFSEVMGYPHGIATIVGLLSSIAGGVVGIAAIWGLAEIGRRLWNGCFSCQDNISERPAEREERRNNGLVVMASALAGAYVGGEYGAKIFGSIGSILIPIPGFGSLIGTAVGFVAGALGGELVCILAKKIGITQRWRNASPKTKAFWLTIAGAAAGVLDYVVSGAKLGALLGFAIPGIGNATGIVFGLVAGFVVGAMILPLARCFWQSSVGQSLRAAWTTFWTKVGAYALYENLSKSFSTLIVAGTSAYTFGWLGEKVGEHLGFIEKKVLEVVGLVVGFIIGLFAKQTAEAAYNEWKKPPEAPEPWGSYVKTLREVKQRDNDERLRWDELARGQAELTRGQEALSDQQVALAAGQAELAAGQAEVLQAVRELKAQTQEAAESAKQAAVRAGQAASATGAIAETADRIDKRDRALTGHITGADPGEVTARAKRRDAGTTEGASAASGSLVPARDAPGVAAS